jgi:hypothetical protein
MAAQPGFESSGLSLDNHRRSVNQCLVLVQRRGETAPGKCCRAHGWRFRRDSPRNGETWKC